MTRRSRSLLITLILLASAVGIMMVVRIPERTAADSGTPAVRAPEILSDFDTTDLVSLNIENPGGGFRLYVSDGDGWRIDGTPEFYRLDEAAAVRTINALSRLRSGNIVAENVSVEKVSEYGLEKPAATVTLEDRESDIKVLEFGNLSPSANGRYCRAAGSNVVVLVPSVIADYAFGTADDYRDMKLPSVNLENLAFLEFRNGDVVFRVEPRTEEDPFGTLVSPYNITSPWRSGYALDDYEFQAVLSEETPLPSLVRTYLDNNDPDDPALGLDEETADRLFVSDTAGGILYLIIGEDDGSGGRYVRLGDRPDAVFILDSSDIAFIETDPFRLLSKFVFLGSITKVSQVKVEKGRDVWIMNRFERGDPDDSRDDRFTVNNLEVAHKEFTSVYQKFIALMREGLVTEDVNLDRPDVRITVSGTEAGVDPMIIRYWPYNDVYYQVSINDGPLEFLVGRYQVEDFVEDLAALAEYGS